MMGTVTILEFHAWSNLPPSSLSHSQATLQQMNQNMHIVGMSHSASDEELSISFKHGMKYFLHKPIDTDLIADIITAKREASNHVLSESVLSPPSSVSSRIREDRDDSREEDRDESKEEDRDEGREEDRESDDESGSVNEYEISDSNELCSMDDTDNPNPYPNHIDINNENSNSNRYNSNDHNNSSTDSNENSTEYDTGATGMSGVKLLRRMSLKQADDSPSRSVM
jgi:hypothetical protein